MGRRGAGGFYELFTSCLLETYRSKLKLIRSGPSRRRRDHMETAATIRIVITEPVTSREVAGNRKKGWAVALLVTAVLIFTCAVGGASLLLTSYVADYEHSFARLGSTLIAVSFPLLFLLAHCIDKFEECKKVTSDW